MNTVKKLVAKIFYILLGLALIAGLIWLLYIAVTIFFDWFSSLQKEVAAGIIVASATVLISVFSLIFSKHYEHKRDIRKEHNSKKIPIYEKLINFIFKVLFAEKTGENPLSEQEIIKFLTEFTPALIIWGDDEVIKSFCLFRDKAVNMASGKSDPNILFFVEELWLTMRKDLGHKDKKIQKGDLLSLFITDIKKYLPQKPSNANDNL